jgi:hypothetical protein
MTFSRRNLLTGVAAGAITLLARDYAFAFSPAASAGSAMTLSNGLPKAKRSSININLLNAFEYAFIDHCKQGDGFPGPIGGFYAATTIPWQQLIDANGWPNNSAASGVPFGGAIRIPGADQFAGPYVITWNGSGAVQFVLGGATWTETNNTGSTYIKNTNGKWTATGGQKARVIVNLSGVIGPQLVVIQIASTGGPAGFLKNVQFYRLEDEADLLAGKIFRGKFKQELVKYNPSLIRFMNWSAVNSAQLARFEHRAVPANASYGNNWIAGPRYGSTSGINKMVLASGAGMPAAMQQGEIVTCRIGAAIARAVAKTVSAISKANPGVVTAAAHGFNTGDVIVHQMMSSAPGQAPRGMTQLDNVPCTITVIDTNNYSIGIDTSAYSTFAVGTAYQYITLNVGGRGEYPVMFGDGVSPASRFGNTYIAAADYKTFTFDKDLVASARVKGAWLFNTIGNHSVLQGGVPLEICTALVNELMAMTKNGPIDMWICIPHRGMVSSDQDYSPGSNWPVNMAKTILNGDNGFAGLDSRCNLFIEHSNETWNTSFAHANFMKKLGYQRWPAAGPYDVSTYSTLRAVISMEEIKATFPNNTRIKYVLAGQGALGTKLATNAVRLTGNLYFNSDVLNVWHATPMSHFDYFAWAGYFDNPDDGSTGANSLGVCTNAWLAAGANPAAQEVVFATYVAGIVGTGSGETTSRYAGTLLPDYATTLTAMGKKTMMYEGGWDKSTTSYMSNQNAFLAACKRSASWAKALRNFHDAFNNVTGAECPAEYNMVNNRWGHSPTDSYLSGVEGANLDLAWQSLVARNNGS